MQNIKSRQTYLNAKCKCNIHKVTPPIPPVPHPSLNLTLKTDINGAEIRPKSQYITSPISLFNPSTSTFLICSINSFLTLFSSPSQLMLINLSIGSIRVVMSFIKEYTVAGVLHARIIFSLILMTERATRKTYADPSTKKTSQTRKSASHTSAYSDRIKRESRMAGMGYLSGKTVGENGEEPIKGNGFKVHS